MLALLATSLLGLAAAAEWLPQGQLYARALADPREPSSSLTLTSTGRIRAALAVGLPVVRWGEGTRVQVGLDAGTWMDFRAEEGLTFAFDTFDGRFGVPVDVARGDARLRLGWRHTSGHQADGMRTAETRPAHITYSREELYVHGGYDFGRVRPYAALSWLARTLPEVGRAGGQLGLVLHPWGPTYLALDLQSRAEDDWRAGLGAQAGLRLGAGSHLPVRVALSAYEGPDRRGQFLGYRERYLGLTLVVERGAPRVDRDEAGSSDPPEVPPTGRPQVQSPGRSG